MWHWARTIGRLPRLQGRTRPPRSHFPESPAPRRRGARPLPPAVSTHRLRRGWVERRSGIQASGPHRPTRRGGLPLRRRRDPEGRRPRLRSAQARAAPARCLPSTAQDQPTPRQTRQRGAERMLARPPSKDRGARQRAEGSQPPRPRRRRTNRQRPAARARHSGDEAASTKRGVYNSSGPRLPRHGRRRITRPTCFSQERAPNPTPLSRPSGPAPLRAPSRAPDARSRLMP